MPRHDTGDWSLYSYRGRESTAAYHELLREFLRSLCDRLRTLRLLRRRRPLRALRRPSRPSWSCSGRELVTRGERTRVRFSLSKLSAVQITITRDGQPALDRVATFRRGRRSFAWKPAGHGRLLDPPGGEGAAHGARPARACERQVGSFPPG